MLRVSLLRSLIVTNRYFHTIHPARIAGIGYLFHILLGWILLCLPWSRTGAVATSTLDHLFIATSAVSTTGLTTVSVSDTYSLFGQIVVLLLIQFGGLGYMTFGSFLLLSTRGELPRLSEHVGKSVFSLPSSFHLNQFLRGVVLFTLLIEAVGAVALYFIFRSVGAPQPAWNAVFHSISSFCTAGFSLFNTSFEAYAGNFWLNFVVGTLSIAGAIGFIVWVDCWRVLTGRARRVTLTTKIILWVTFWLCLLGALLIFATDPVIGSRSAESALLASFFQSMTAVTTVGFNTIPLSQLSRASLLVLTFLMIIGASPAGTGGGLKSTTLSALIGVMKSVIRGQQEVRFFGRPIPAPRVWAAMAAIGFYLFLFVVGTYLLELTESFEFEQIVFEAASALGTVGLSLGITPSLSSLGKITVILLMFCGRLGPLTFGMALFFRPPEKSPLDNDLAV